MAIVSKFESPAIEYQALNSLNLHSLIVGQHNHSIFFAYADGDDLASHGIRHGDLLVVDRALRAKDQDIVLAIIDGEFCARLYSEKQHALICDNHPPLPITDGIDITAVIPQTIRCHRQLVN